MTYQIIAAFKAAMLAEGIEPPEPPDHIEADGVLHRFHIQGQKSGSLNGAYTLHLDGARPAGYAEDFKAGIKFYWKSDAPVKPLTQPERAALEAAKLKRAQQLTQRHDRAAKRAQAIWQAAEVAHHD